MGSSFVNSLSKFNASRRFFFRINKSNKLQKVPFLKESSILKPYDFGSEGRLHFPRFQGLPVDLLKEWMDSNSRLRSLTRHASKSPGRVLRHELQSGREWVNPSDSVNRILCSIYPFEDGDGLFREPDWVEDVVMQDRFEEVVFVVRLERWLAGHHFVHEHSKGPPVDGSAVGQLLQDLWGNVVGRSAKGVGRDTVHDPFLAHAEVRNLAVSFAVQQNVVQLQISVRSG